MSSTTGLPSSNEVGTDLHLSGATLLDADPRATFLIEWTPSSPSPFAIAFANSVLRDTPGLRDEVEARTDKAKRFRSWAIAASHWTYEYDFAGRAWIAFALGEKWKVIQAARSTGEAVAQVNGAALEVDEAASRVRTAMVLNDARVEALQRMMQMSDVGVFEYSSTGQLLQANDAWYKYSGLPKGELGLDYTFMDLVYPDDEDLVMSKWNDLVQGKSLTFEMRWRQAAGELSQTQNLEDGAQWVLSACVPIQDDQGQVLSIAGNTIDISAQKRGLKAMVQRAEALERLSDVEDKFSRFAELAPVAMYIFDEHHKMVYCNEKFFEVTGHPRVPYEEVDWVSIVYPEDIPKVQEGWKSVLEQKGTGIMQFRLNRTWLVGDGTQARAWAQGQSHPDFRPDGTIKSTLGIVTDISQFKWVENIQRQKVEEVLEAKRQQENFIDMTSHEMRNPLSAVIQCADSAIESFQHILATSQDTKPPSATDTATLLTEITSGLDALQTIISCSMHQKRIIDDILTLSKLDSSLILITPIRAQPRTVVTDTIKMFEVECNKLGIDLVFRPDPSVITHNAETVMMDPSRLIQVLINLITNAIKFTRTRPAKKIAVELGASLENPRNTWPDIQFAGHPNQSQTCILDKADWGDGPKLFLWIKVTDTGCGIAFEQQGTLFSRFMQATPRTHIQYGGSGLGLFICKSLAELQGGGIGLKSEQDVGSTFAFFISARGTPPPPPKLKALSRQESLRDESNELAMPSPPILASESRAETPETPETPSRAAPYSVLIVEDNIVNQKILAQQLRKIGCNVQVADHGVAAIDHIKTTLFNPTLLETGLPLDIVLMDIEMPVMNGLVCTREIRRMEEEGILVGHVPILAVSANARPEQVKQATDAGVDGAIAKPFRLADLIPRIEGLIQGTRH